MNHKTNYDDDDDGVGDSSRGMCYDSHVIYCGSFH